MPKHWIICIKFINPIFSGYSKNKNCLTLVVPLPTHLQPSKCDTRVDVEGGEVSVSSNFFTIKPSYDEWFM